MRTGFTKLLLSSLLFIFLTACSNSDEDIFEPPPLRLKISSPSAVSYTYQSADGSRYATGQGSLSPQNYLDLTLSDTPKWVLGLPWQNGTAWITVLNNNNVEAYSVIAGDTKPLTVLPQQYNGKASPIAIIDEDGTLKLANISESGNEASGATAFADLQQGRRAYVRNNGDLVIETLSDDIVFPVDALPNTRIVSDGSQRLLALANPGSINGHEVLGRDSVASQILLIDASNSPRIVNTINSPSGQFFEGNALMWVDMNNDGVRDIITTIADAENGAYLAVLDAEGNIISRSTAIGQSFRWRHQLAAAPFSGSAQWELASVKFPHLPNITEVEFLKMNGENFEITFSDTRFDLTSHRNSLGNTDMGVAADIDNDGRVEVLIPSEDFMDIGVLEYDNSTTKEETEKRLAIGGYLTTNLATTNDANGQLWLAAGHAGQKLRIWF